MPKGPVLRPAEIDAIVAAVKKKRKDGNNLTASYRIVGNQLGYPEKTVADVFRMMRPTVHAATDLIRARAFKMVSKVIRKGSPSELIDVLSRPNIGVLEPIRKQADSGGGGFFMSVTSDTCGAFKIGVSNGLPAQNQQLQAQDVPALGPGASDWDDDETAVDAEDAAEDGAGGGHDGVREILGGVQEADEQPRQTEALLAEPEGEEAIEVLPYQATRKVGMGVSKVYEEALVKANKRLVTSQKRRAQKDRLIARRAAEAGGV